jgi:hypothetical protein
MACGPAGYRGEAWLEKGLLSLVTALPVLAVQQSDVMRRRRR